MKYRITIDNEPSGWRERELLDKGLNKFHIRHLDNPDEEPYTCFAENRRNAVRQYVYHLKKKR